MRRHFGTSRRYPLGLVSRARPRPRHNRLAYLHIGRAWLRNDTFVVRIFDPGDHVRQGSYVDVDCNGCIGRGSICQCWILRFVLTAMN